MTAATVATGREAHVDTAAVRSEAAWRAGLGFGWAPQIIQLSRGDRGGRDGGLDIMGITEASPRRATFFLYPTIMLRSRSF